MCFIIYIIGILIPFVGTFIGALLVLFAKGKECNKYNSLLYGFSSGVMLASSIWSLINPALEMVNGYFIILLIISFMIGIILFILIDRYIHRLKNNMMFLSITIHNIPEGMIVGIVLASAYFGNAYLSITSAIALSIGIGIQNIPEGAIVSIPQIASGKSKKKALWYGVLSGIVEPIASAFTFLISFYVEMLLPYLLMFASATMIYVVIEELIPEMKDNKYSAIFFSIGFLLMMVLDILL